MSSLRFTKPLKIKGLPPEAEAEWVDLEVGLASAFPLSIGHLALEPARQWDEQLGVYRIDGPFSHDPTEFSHELMDKYWWVSHFALVEACKYEEPQRPHILAWLESEEGKHFEYFCVTKEVAEYIP